MNAPARAPIDFADWLSPMLVKELRQGVRTRVFVSMFILLQVLMLMNISLSLLVASFQQDASEGATYFWLLVSVPVLIVLPLNGLGAVGSEIKANTLELIFLTRLSALRIVVGKWLAVFAQAALLVCAVLPYLVLRYFIGGVNLSTELLTLATMLLTSALLSACAVGLSAYPARVVRPLAVVAVLLALMGAGQIITYYFIGTRPVTTVSSGAAHYLCLLALYGIGACLMLELGAAKIAPPAENHSASMRLLAFGALGVAVVGGFFLRATTDVTILALLIVAGICAVAVGEEPRLIASIYRPFSRRGWLGRRVGGLLYPGWPSGVLFMAIIFLLFGLLMAHQRLLAEGSHAVEFVALAGALLFPVAVQRFFFRRFPRPVVVVLVINFTCVLAALFCEIFDHALTSSTREFGAILPLSSLIMAVPDSASEVEGRMLQALGGLGISVLLLLFAIVRPLREMRAVERESLTLPAEPAVAVHAPVA